MYRDIYIRFTFVYVCILKMKEFRTRKIKLITHLVLIKNNNVIKKCRNLMECMVEFIYERQLGEFIKLMQKIVLETPSRRW